MGFTASCGDLREGLETGSANSRSEPNREVRCARRGCVQRLNSDRAERFAKLIEECFSLGLLI